MLETILMALAGIGLLTIIYGRHKMICDTGGELPFLWIIALRLIPFSDLVYMVRHFTQARTGGLIAIAGMWLMVPYAGTKLWKEQTAFRQQFEQRSAKLTERMESAGEDDLLSSQALAEMPAEEAVAFTKYRDHKLVEKEKLVNQLSARLSWWHEQLQKRKAALNPDDEAAIREFNAEAAAYANLNEIAREKSQELLTLRSVAKR